MSCRASFSLSPGEAGLPRRWPGRRPWRRVLPVPMSRLTRCDAPTAPATLTPARP
jgi:hypothetical protein